MGGSGLAFLRDENAVTQGRQGKPGGNAYGAAANDDDIECHRA